MSSPRIFISHSHLDNAFCQQLVEDLRRLLGEDAVWYDASGGLHGGDAWWDRIVAEITERTTFIVILTPEALASKWVPKEMSIAYRLNVELGHQLIPIMLKPCQRRPDWALIQEVDFVAPRSYAEAFADLCGVLGISATSAAPAASPLTDRRSPVVQRLTQETHTAFGREDWSGVFDKTDALMQLGEMTPVQWRERGLAFLALNQPTPALDALDRALAADPHDLPTLRAKARAQAMLGQDDAAAQTLTLAQALAPLDDAATRLPLLADLYDVLLRLNRRDDAQRRVQDALRLAPNDAQWQNRQRDLLLASFADRYAAAMQAKDFAMALAACDEALAKYPSDAAWQQRRAQVLTAQDQQRRDEAERLRQQQLAAEQERQRQEQAQKDKLLPPRLRSLGFALLPGKDVIVPPTVAVPAGTFTMGGDSGSYNGTSRAKVTLAAFRLCTYPLTVAEWACALAMKAVPEPENKYGVSWQQQQSHPDHPVVNVSWLDVRQFAAWLSQQTGETWRLPTEAEWEYAARGTDGRVYPWGNQWDKTRANTGESGVDTTTPVGTYADKGDASPWGAHDMAGNVWEWTSSLWRDDKPYDANACEKDADATSMRVLRGGAWSGGPQDARAASRNWGGPTIRYSRLGARLVLVARLVQ